MTGDRVFMACPPCFLDEITSIAHKCKELMLQRREKRPKPFLDDKVCAGETQ